MGTGLVVDADTLALWEAVAASGDLIDATGNYVLTKFGAIAGGSGLVGDSVILDASTKYYTHAGDAALRSLSADAAWTVEAFIKLLPNAGTFPGGGVVVFTLEHPVNNAWGIWLRAYGLNQLYAGGYIGDGGAGFVQYSHTPTLEPMVEVPSNEWLYVAWTCQIYPSAGNYRIAYFINGRCVGTTQSPIGECPSFAGAALCIGNWWTAPSVVGTNDFTHGEIEQIRLSTITRTRDEIRQNWLNYAGGSDPDPTPPTVELVSHPEGQIGSSDPVVIDITSPSGLSLVVLSAQFNGSSETIYSSSRGFTARYRSSENTVETITDGVRVTMLRSGGWPAATIIFDPDVVTATGVVNP